MDVVMLVRYRRVGRRRGRGSRVEEHGNLVLQIVRGSLLSPWTGRGWEFLFARRTMADNTSLERSEALDLGL